MKGLALDFDGVISNSAPEAFVVALRTYAELRPRSRLAERTARLDAGRPERDPLYPRFLALVPLGNRAEDYAIALRALEEEAPPTDQRSYDAFRAQLDPGWLRDFHERFYRVRAAWSRSDREAWLALMPAYPQFVELMRRRGREAELAIATSKDRRSVRQLLRHYGIDDLIAEDRVLDKEAGKSKRAHLVRLHETLGIDYPELTFVDDKVNHLEGVASLGVRCVLAAWGYNGPREHRRALECGFSVCGLEDVEAVLFER